MKKTKEAAGCSLARCFPNVQASARSGSLSLFSPAHIYIISNFFLFFSTAAASLTLITRALVACQIAPDAGRFIARQI